MYEPSISPVLEMKKVAFSKMGVVGLWSDLFISVTCAEDADTGRTMDPGTMQILHSFAKA